MDFPKIAVLDYGMGNLRSVAKALELVGAAPAVTSDTKVIEAADAVVFPGVGSFGPAVANLDSCRLRETIARTIEREKPFLGLCLGFQLLFSYSEEEGRHEGLGIVPGGVKKFDFSGLPAERRRALKVPHMGWNTVSIANDEARSRMFRGIPDNSYFYFVHSYYGAPDSPEMTAGRTVYGAEFCAAVMKGTTWGCQFHPEKSGDTGIQLLRNFVHEVKK